MKRAVTSVSATSRIRVSMARRFSFRFASGRKGHVKNRSDRRRRNSAARREGAADVLLRVGRRVCRLRRSSAPPCAGCAVGSASGPERTLRSEPRQRAGASKDPPGPGGLFEKVGNLVACGSAGSCRRAVLKATRNGCHRLRRSRREVNSANASCSRAGLRTKHRRCFAERAGGGLCFSLTWGSWRGSTSSGSRPSHRSKKGNLFVLLRGAFRPLIVVESGEPAAR